MSVNSDIEFPIKKIIKICKSLSFIRITDQESCVNLIKITDLGRVHVKLIKVSKDITNINIHHDIFGPLGEHHTKRRDTVPKKFYTIIMNKLYNRRNKR